MKITCEKHGELECNPPNKAGNVYCPKCMCEMVAVAFNMGDVTPEEMATDDLGYPLFYRPYIPLQVTPIFVDGKHKGVSIGGKASLVNDADGKPLYVNLEPDDE